MGRSYRVARGWSGSGRSYYSGSCGVDKIKFGTVAEHMANVIGFG